MIEMSRTLTIWLIVFAVHFLPAGCSRKDFLDENPNTDFLIPNSLKDCRALLDDEPTMKQTPSMGEISSDNFYFGESYWDFIEPKTRNIYLWAEKIYIANEGGIDDWNLPYKQVFHCNVVLEALSNIPKTNANEKEWNEIKGNALFLRAYAFFNIAQVFATVYDAATANQDLGIPLRLNTNIKEVSTRASVAASYDQIIRDLTEALSLLSDPVPSYYRNRPIKTAVLAMLARVFVSMREYDEALLYADQCLKLYDRLIDYNTENITSDQPFTRWNDETLYQSILSNASVLTGIMLGDGIVDSILFRSYSVNDLRRIAFFGTNTDNQPIPKGNYSGTVLPFTGLATDEVYLIRSECYARKGSVELALNDLNELLVHRWKAGTFIPFTAGSATEALQLILTERRKELPFRGVRWSDLRRLNKEGANITLKRKFNDSEYILLPGDKKYVLPIPEDVINQSGMPQNDR